LYLTITWKTGIRHGWNNSKIQWKNRRKG